MRPIGDAGDESVFDGIVMNVIDVALQIGIIADGVLPIAALPNSSFTLRDFALERDGATGRPREKPDLKMLQREPKSASPSGRSQSA